MSFKFKTAEELKEYLDNLGIEYRYRCFSEKNSEVCHLLGDYLDLIKSDFNKAAKIYKANCDDYNHPRSCHAYGNYALFGKGQEKKSLETAYKYYLKACDLSNAPSCFNAGILTLQGDENAKIERNQARGLELLDKGCTLQNTRSCYYLSGLYINGAKDKEIEKDMKLAFQYSEKACALGNVYACANLSIMYKRGEGVEKDQKMSEKYRNIVEQMKAEVEVTNIDPDKQFEN